jgi:hypothetical protein
VSRRRLRRELSAGAVVAVLAVAGAYLSAESSGAFQSQGEIGRTLRLVCPLH